MHQTISSEDVTEQGRGFIGIFSLFFRFQFERINFIRFVSGFSLGNSHYVAKMTWKISVPTKFIRFAMVESFDLDQKWLEKLQKTPAAQNFLQWAQIGLKYRKFSTIFVILNEWIKFIRFKNMPMKPP